MAEAPIVLFDGDCVFCSASMAFIARHDRSGALRFAALGSPRGRALADARGLEEEHPDSFYVLLNDETLSDARALRFVAARLDWPWRLLTAPALLPAGLVNRFYGIAGRRAQCFAPSGPERDRFLV